MDPLKRQTSTATPAEPGGLFCLARAELNRCHSLRITCHELPFTPRHFRERDCFLRCAVGTAWGLICAMK